MAEYGGYPPEPEQKQRCSESALKRLVIFLSLPSNNRKIADHLNAVGALWGTLALIPTCIFDSLEKYNGVVFGVFALMVSLQVLFLRYAMRER